MARKAEQTCLNHSGVSICCDILTYVPYEQDEPSTGLDPASRRTLWTCIREAKKTRAILLTTHSMEEAGV